uniref:Mu-like prophage tail sheath protein gpL n=1 Tax=Candidatus Kentrum sp. LFY TaxID=2126342 RepID=A0A450UE92_9GAMM|nr:MAG: Mu-like prophage tail sheath protein gpL [Candidatus Kentron sp. LFY]
MTITFDEIPQALRYPGVYVEIDGSRAGLGGDLPKVLLVGQKLATGTSPAGEVVRIAGIEDAKVKAGAGSMLAEMAERYRKADSTFDLYLLPYADNAAGTQATGTITVTGAPSANGVLALYIAGRPVNVAIASTDTMDQIATKIAQAVIDAGTKIPVTAAAATNVATLTARHKGTCGDDIDIRSNLYGEKSPAGLVVAISAMSGGAGDPDPGNLESLIGQEWFRYVVLGMNDSATLAAWHTESRRRYMPPIQAGFRVFCAHRGGYADAATFGESKNYEHVAMLSLAINPNTTWDAAATLAGAVAPRLHNNPVISLEGVALPGIKGVEYHDFTNANSLLFKGMSIMEVGKDGSCYVKRLITMYQYRSDGSADDAWLDINTPEVMERIRYEQRIGAMKRFSGTVAAKSNEGFRPGLPITTVDSVKAFLLSLYRYTLMREYGWVQAYDYYKSKLVVEQDVDNPSRFNFMDAPVVTSPFYILAGRSQFRKSASAS